MRILCIGDNLKEGKDYYNAKFDKLNSFPAIFDFDIIILEIPLGTYSGEQKSYETICNLRNEFAELLSSKGFCFVMSNKINKMIYDDDINNYSWCPFNITVINNNGTTVVCTSEKAKWLFEAIDFSWNCYFTKYPEGTSILATNRAGHPISIIVPYKGGHCVFLPYTDEKNDLAALLAQRGLNIIPEAFDDEDEEETPAEVPIWIGELSTKEEEKLLKQQKEIEKKIQKRTKFKRLLYEKGTALQKLVGDVFKELGFEVERLSNDSYADLEIALNGKIGAIEVTGSEGSVDLRKARQLLNYYINQKEIEKRDVKGILVVNHYQKQPPKERGDVATEDVINLANTYNFCILSTTELYGFLEGFLNDKITKGDILEVLYRTGL